MLLIGRSVLTWNERGADWNIIRSAVGNDHSEWLWLKETTEYECCWNIVIVKNQGWWRWWTLRVLCSELAAPRLADPHIKNSFRPDWPHRMDASRRLLKVGRDRRRLFRVRSIRPSTYRRRYVRFVIACARLQQIANGLRTYRCFSIEIFDILPQIRPLADIVHSKYSFTYLLTLSSSPSVIKYWYVTNWQFSRFSPAQWCDNNMIRVSCIGVAFQCCSITLY